MIRQLSFVLVAFLFAASCVGQTPYDLVRDAWIELRPVHMYPTSAYELGGIDVILSATGTYRLSDRVDLHATPTVSIDDEDASLSVGLGYIDHLDDTGWRFRASFDVNETLTWRSGQTDGLINGDGNTLTSADNYPRLLSLFWVVAGVEVFTGANFGELLQAYPGVGVRKAHVVSGSAYRYPRRQHVLLSRWRAEVTLQAPLFLTLTSALAVTATPMIVFRNGPGDASLSLGLIARI